MLGRKIHLVKFSVIDKSLRGLHARCLTVTKNTRIGSEHPRRGQSLFMEREVRLQITLMQRMNRCERPAGVKPRQGSPGQSFAFFSLANRMVLVALALLIDPRYIRRRIDARILAGSGITQQVENRFADSSSEHEAC